MRIPILQQTATGPYPVNMYFDAGAHESLNLPGLVGIPGMTEFYAPTAWGFEVRQLHVANDKLYAVIGDRVYKVNAEGNGELLDNRLGKMSGPVCMADDGTYILIVEPNLEGYIIDTRIEDDVSPISDADFPVPAYLAWQDGYFAVPEKGTGSFVISGVYDPESWDALDITTAEGHPDDILANWMDHRELWNFGENTIEVYYNSGNAVFPFERIQGAFIQQGIGAIHSIASGDNTIFFLDKLGRVMRISGYSPSVISTPFIEHEITGLSTFSDAIGFYYTQQGHGFYVLTFPTGDITWVYDVSNPKYGWHRRKSFPVKKEATEGRWRGNCYAYFDGKHIIGDYASGQLFELDADTYTDDSNELRRYVDFPAIGDGGQKIRHNKLRIDFEVGLGLTSGAGSDPQAMLKWSDDGGKTWGNEIWQDIRVKGKYKSSVFFRRLGASKRRIYRLGVSDPIKIAITGAFLN